MILRELGAAPGFRPGDFVTIAIAEPPVEGVALIPARALGSDGTLLVLGEGNRLEEVSADIVRRQGEEVLIRVGTLEGREIVAERAAFLGAGILVKPVRGAGAGQGAGADGYIELTPERRAALIAFVEASAAMPEKDRAAVLAQLRAPRVLSDVVSRIEARMGG